VFEQYTVLGLYDFVSIVEAPDNDAIFRTSVELGSCGTIGIMSLPAITVYKLIMSLRK
jgi:uncharacterized protein with GYD domain